MCNLNYIILLLLLYIKNRLQQCQFSVMQSDKDTGHYGFIWFLVLMSFFDINEFQLWCAFEKSLVVEGRPEIKKHLQIIDVHLNLCMFSIWEQYYNVMSTSMGSILTSVQSTLMEVTRGQQYVWTVKLSSLWYFMQGKTKNYLQLLFDQSPDLGERGCWGCLTSRLLFGNLETLAHILPVDDVPDCFNIVRSYIFVLKVVGMLPHINTKERDETWGAKIGKKLSAISYLTCWQKTFFHWPVVPCRGSWLAQAAIRSLPLSLS